MLASEDSVEWDLDECMAWYIRLTDGDTLCGSEALDTRRDSRMKTERFVDDGIKKLNFGKGVVVVVGKCVQLSLELFSELFIPGEMEE